MKASMVFFVNITIKRMKHEILRSKTRRENLKYLGEQRARKTNEEDNLSQKYVSHYCNHLSLGKLKWSLKINKMHEEVSHRK